MPTIAETLTSLRRADPSEIKKIPDTDLREALNAAIGELRRRGWEPYQTHNELIKFSKTVRL